MDVGIAVVLDERKWKALLAECESGVLTCSGPAGAGAENTGRVLSGVKGDCAAASTVGVDNDPAAGDCAAASADGEDNDAAAGDCAAASCVGENNDSAAIGDADSCTVCVSCSVNVLHASVVVCCSGD